MIENKIKIKKLMERNNFEFGSNGLKIKFIKDFKIEEDLNYQKQLFITRKIPTERISLCLIQERLYCLLTLFDLLDKRQIDFNFTFEYLLADFLEKNKEKFFDFSKILINEKFFL